MGKESMMRIPFSAPYTGQAEEEAVLAALRSGWVAPVGPQLDAFEQALCHRFGYQHALAVNSGTAALHLALVLAGVTKADRVLVGTMTFVAAGNAVRYVGGTPVFMDSDYQTWGLDAQLLDSYLTACTPRNKPKALIATYAYGLPIHIQDIASICYRHQVCLIEDAAEALGTYIEGVPAGGWGDFAILSFNGNKILTTGGGGALVCRNEHDHAKALKLATQAKEPADHYEHQVQGYNYRMSNVSAGLGLGQLSRFDEIISRKKMIAEQYDSCLGDLEWLQKAEVANGSVPNHWTNAYLIDKGAGVSPSQVLKVLARKNVEARRFWKPLHLQPLFKSAESVGGAVSLDLFERGICLPSGAGMDEKDVEWVVAALKSRV